MAEAALRGEYKVRGGKLVAVDLEIVDGRLARVHVSGDFFLEPDDALDEINAALEGQPANASVADLAAAIRARLSPDARLIGFDPEAVGIAVRRAVRGALGWNDLTFEVMGPKVMDPTLHVALDQVIPDEVSQGVRGPVFRFWDWDRPLVVIGSFQSVRNEVDEANARKYGIKVVRRITGGGAMFMEQGNCITYSMVVPGSLVEGLSYEQSYAYLDDWVLGALAEVGVNATYKPLNDIASDKGKIGGAAQRRLVDGTVLHHVTMSYDIDADKMMEVLRIGREKLSDKGTKSANKRVDPMRSQTGLPRDEIFTRFLAYFKNRYNCFDSDYTPEEMARAQQLVDTKFNTPEWTYRVP
ncbi:lipoate--protein ligase family protein [Propionibacterium freudenreichii]|uniref:lipoate--protein ligase family protein n=1 Tax=Propionibacterium freudenreichii TaxID=1744 RepID=UPI00054209AE|nr:biotin/lipoate A/B protein ligase family protein [Propionibacterium freudenreichii]CEH01482.1 Lipoate-protein ligase A [Propionibacterium freudenreichii]CEH05508.1 Lipoate-protein ligase A [Propionibacterium freudenreichii]CEI29679.1 Lipoate-protein ligase A [Propionibacterium freudenreichii]SBN51904.1 Lipoate-protein ligase LplJ [Propionibacterium freudenreichii]SBN60113.1 Lipoate-protein ligase LplJ [Propionibacterium freudenreichii]